MKKAPGKEPGTMIVTFEVPAAPPTSTVVVAGDFNDWSHDATPLERIGDVFCVSVTLPVGRRYRFRYLIDGTRWENDWRADDYWRNEFGGDDSVVSTDGD